MNALFFAVMLLLSASNAFKLSGRKAMHTSQRLAPPDHALDLPAIVKGVFDEKSATITLQILAKAEVYQLRDFEGLTTFEIEEILRLIKQTKRRSALKKALLAVLPPVTDSGEYGFRLKKKIHVIGLEDSRAPVTRTFSVTRDSVQYILQKILCLVAENGEEIVEFDQLEDGQTYRAVSYSDAPERRFKVIDEQLEIDAARQLHKHVLQQYPEAHIHHNVKVYRRGNERAQFDAVVHVDGAGGSFVFVMEAKTHVHPTDLAVALDKAAIFRDLLGQDLSFTEGFLPEQPNTWPFSHFASSEVIPCLAGGHFTPELVELCLGDGVNAIYPSGDGFDVALVQK